MLKKIMAASAICAIACGISYGKTGALDIMELSLKDLGKQGVEYYCVGNETHATCFFKDTDTALFQLNNMRADMWLTDNQVKQEISGNVNTRFFENDYSKFIPKSFKCESTSTLQDLQTAGIGNCVIKSDVATLSLDSKALTESKSFRYKTMPSIIMQYITQAEQLGKEYDRIQTKYNNEVAALRNQTIEDKENIQSQIDMLATSRKKLYKSEQGCGCNTCATLGKEEAINTMLRIKNAEKEQIIKNYDASYDEIQKRYEEDMQAFTQSVVSWLKQYNFTLQEARIYLRTNKLGDEVFAAFAKDYLSFNENIPLTKEQKQERSEYKKKITAKYYSGLEAMRAASMTFIERSPYLSEHLRKNLQKIVAEHAKLFDSHSHKSSLKVLITPLKQDAMNLGDEAQKLINAYNQSEIENSDGLLRAVFDIINQYDVKAVKSFSSDK